VGEIAGSNPVVPTIFTHMNPANLPERLSATAFLNGEDVAWEQKDCANAIDWLSQNGYAILGIELWLIIDGGIRSSIRTKSGAAIYVTSCDPRERESWKSYVERSARDAAEKISAFHWPTDSVESPSPVYFNLCWADREWFRTHNKHAAHTFDE
jgi:hypothetical protein